MDTEWAYLAGVIDGEGTISYNRKNKAGSVSLKITQADFNLVLLDWVVEFLAASEITFSWFAAEKTDYPHSTVTVNEQASLRVVLVETIPYLTLKKERAIEAVRFLDAKAALREHRDTHCKNGHLREGNTMIERSFVKGRSWRRCILCKAEASRKYRATHA